MFTFEDGHEFDMKFLDQDSAVLEALEKVDTDIFDMPEGKDEDLDALFEKAS